jgi:hypothetical protein
LLYWRLIFAFDICVAFGIGVGYTEFVFQFFTLIRRSAWNIRSRNFGKNCENIHTRSI